MLNILHNKQKDKNTSVYRGNLLACWARSESRHRMCCIVPTSWSQMPEVLFWGFIIIIFIIITSFLLFDVQMDS